MTCHGELALAKPDPSRLTAFYLAVAAGGALGGAFVGLVAPRIFDDFFELQWGLFLCPVLVLLSLFTQEGSPLRRGRPIWAWLALGPGVAVLGVYLALPLSPLHQFTVASSRDFFGVLKLFEAPSNNPRGRVRLLGNGGIIHGFQWIEPESLRSLLTGYYGKGSGLDEAVQIVRTRGAIHAGFVGLGVGTAAGWGIAGDQFRFYEINPGVVRIAREQFSFLRDSLAAVEIVEGDARLALEAEPAQHFDLLVLDAFTGDSIPIHLLTAEAFALYRRHLEEPGVLAVHVSNKHLELAPVVRRLGEATGMGSIERVSGTDLSHGASGAEWVLLSAKPDLFDELARRHPPPSRPASAALWTDDYANVISIVR
jgi:hypothetical protein